ncbi:23S rRNA (uracil(747)-C(5))-methyltransferase RlmC [Acerihabitans sp. TG2]|uniref:23S rRNA (uracil(747)-C(5))-methyltransferase RlmC n=1 Tax=Acerihabitans sp. TG2 TaxID=3096008 RepID=UPI002B22C8CE|nr:23S rRNA (uracil(747)-C(5))-methyltransferase RlmC [Acerihabitans sp. TG2]MEA9390613.1 23S rRNA (uracil(747)-C(5))-methyltransferase RlmC [Acerihabitans sp. TG2]
MHCELFSTGRCRSCQWLDRPYPQQLADKQAAITQLLSFQPVGEWLAPVGCVTQAFRNKAKMVVGGSVERPILGITSAAGQPLDLCRCPLYPSSFVPVFHLLKSFIGRAGLTPYDVARRRGELKFLLLTASDFDGGMMLRFVLRSSTKLAQLRAALPWLQSQLPLLKVISANIQPVHMAILEGETEIILTEQTALEERLNDVPLFIRPRGFFQTNPAIAARLYAAARQWVGMLHIDSLWDLFCGVGGFGLHCASADTRLTGIEISPEAIASARQSAQQLGLRHVTFAALDSTQFARQGADLPDLVLVNPPRRGIGQELCNYLNQMAPPYILYSSCQGESLAKDLQALSGYDILKAQLFDMFPHTAHYETLVLLKRAASVAPFETQCTVLHQPHQ